MLLGRPTDRSGSGPVLTGNSSVINPQPAAPGQNRTLKPQLRFPESGQLRRLIGLRNPPHA